jgi:hypothetical protein
MAILDFEPFAERVNAEIDRQASRYNDRPTLQRDHERFEWRRINGSVVLAADGDRAFIVGSYNADRTPIQSFSRDQRDDTLGLREAIVAVINRLDRLGP